MSGVTVDKSEVTYKIGTMKATARRSELDKQKLLEAMIEEEMIIGEPPNLMRYLILFWFGVGVFACRRDLKLYYRRLSEEKDGLDYTQWYADNSLIARLI